MKQRIITGGLFTAVLALVLIFRQWIMLHVLLGVCLLCCHELLNAFVHKGYQPALGMTYLCAAIPLPVMWFFGPGIAFDVSLISLFVLLICHLFRKEPSLCDTASALFSTIYVSLPLSLLFSLNHVQPDALSGLLMTAAFLFAYAGDMCAYFTGTLCGRHRMAPVLSPKKTWEGAAGGLIGSVAVGAALFFAGKHFNVDLPLKHCLLLAFFSGIAAQIGDLTASLIKRHCGVKDYGKLFPGHGGMMDRIDSVLFTVVVIFIYCLEAQLL